ncbi:hypothetical protein [Nocardioides zeae]
MSRLEPPPISTPPTIAAPVTISVVASPSKRTSWPSPMVPPAPGTLTTWTLPTMPSVRTACWYSRAARS